MVSHNITAGTDTPPAKDTAVMVHEKELTRAVNREPRIRGRIGPVVQSILVSQVLEFTIPAHLAKHAIVVSFRKEHLQDKFPQLKDPGAVSLYIHTFPDGIGAGRLQGSFPFNLHYTHSASAQVFQGWMMA
jgi:hypothetical protein